MQIKAIGLWNERGELRRIDLKPGSLNVITGESQTGKSTLLDILRWCLGSDQLRVPQGPISQTVTYYGALVQIGGTEVFLGRPAPPAGQATATAAQLEIGAVDFPDFDELQPTTNAESVRDWLGSAVGIEENLHEPPAGQTRAPLAAEFVHSLYYCFQRQDEIASQRHLFHHQSEEFIPQTIKDTLPYFLGATGSADLRLQAELRRVRQDLRAAQRRLDRTKSDLDAGIDASNTLVSEAVDVGLLPAPEERPAGISAARALLAQALDTPIESAPMQVRGEEWDRLQRARTALSEQARHLREQRELIAAFETDDDAYERELSEQRVRLQSVTLLPRQSDEGTDSCPLCASELPDPLPSVTALRASVQTIESQLDSVERDRPQLVGAVERLTEQERQVRTGLDANRLALEALASQDDQLAAHRDGLNLQAYVRGRIDQFLQSTEAAEGDGLAELERAVVALQVRANEIEAALDPQTIRERATSMLNVVGRDMTEWAGELGLEHSDESVRIDLSRLTVVADTSDAGPVFMDSSIGSAKNWVGYHLVSYLALQKWFIGHQRPVPSFVILDQPTQAFFPPDQPADQVEATDRQDALDQFKLIQQVVEALDGSLQVIVLDHADFDEPWFQESVVERWRGDRKLIPRGWLE